MWWCKRPRGLMLAAALALGGCGFHPLYSTEPALGYDPLLASIDVRPVPDRAGQILAQSVRDQLNPRGAQLRPRYVLTIGMTVTHSDLGIRRDNTSTRGEVTINASLTLNDAATHAAVFHDTIRTVTAFNQPDDAYAATVAADHARDEAVTDLGSEIAERVTLYLRSKVAGAGI
jgi:LPS-assembly lipoprotein